MVNFAQVTPQDVQEAVSEYDRVGQDEFLHGHGFGRNRGYELMVDGKAYDSKAVLGVAHRYATGALASSSEFSGGKHGAAKVLGDLGFEVSQPAASSPEVIPATGSWRDVSDIGSEAAREAWSGAARPVLLDIARRYQAVITYSELSAEIQRQTGIRTKQGLQHWIGKVLERVAIDCHERDEPNLSSLVVNSSGSVGAGYATAVRTIGGEEPADHDDHAAAERLACYRFFEAAGLPANGGTAALSPQLAQRRERVRARATPPPEPILCPTCFIALPSSGQCDGCA